MARQAAHELDGEELRVGLVAHDGEDVGERLERRDAVGGRVALHQAALRQTEQSAARDAICNDIIAR